MSPTAINNIGTVEIVNIHHNDLNFSLVDDLYKNLSPPKDKAQAFPTLLLYDAKGLKLFEKITYLEDYYLTNAEIEILTTHAKRIVERIPENAQLVELGSGNLRKVEILLKECERTQKRVDYYALDLSLVELQRTFAEVSTESFKYVEFRGLHGTYDDGLAWLKRPENRLKPTVVLSMGSSIGNFSRSDAAEFLKGFSKVLNPGDFFLIGLDGCKDPERVFKAYNDSEGVTRQFYENGLAHANRILGYEAFKSDEWEILTGYGVEEGRHQACYAPKIDVTINDITIPKGQKLVFEESYKYGREERDALCRGAGLIPQVDFENSADNYYIYMLSPTAFDNPTRPADYASRVVPTVMEFRSLWTAWDIVTKTMTPREELLSKPIKLRNALIFYLGHIPAFLDIHVTRALQYKLTEPAHYPRIFERGIDPDVEDPEQCHAHSEIPDEWPALNDILEYEERVRQRARSLLQSDAALTNRTLGEALWIGFEHEVLHLETFLYMLLQSKKSLPPVGVDPPDFAHMAWMAKKNKKPNAWFRIPEQTLTVGLDDSNTNVMPRDSFGWDNEKPQRVITVPSFEAQARPVTNGEYASYLQANHLESFPASWESVKPQTTNSSNNGSGPTEDFLSTFAVLTVFGPVPLVLAQDWPLIASYDELALYAKWVGCRIPTYEETQSIYLHSDHLRQGIPNGVQNGTKSVEQRDQMVAASNGASGPTANGDSSDPTSAQKPAVFRDLEGCNVGFKNWHPVPVTPNGDRLAGQGDMGGVWEWTSTPIKPHDGFKAMEIYPGYTSDFFDGKHHIVLGGSWATLPRIAGRTTFVNWYQHNYPYAWAGARLVKDVSA